MANTGKQDNRIKIDQIRSGKSLATSDWKTLKRLLQQDYLRHPDDEFTVSYLTYVCYRLGEYKAALKYCLKTQQFNARDPLYLSTHADILYKLKQYSRAIGIYKKIIRMEPSVARQVKAGKAKRWELELINDCRYGLAIYYQKRGKAHLAKKWIQRHIEIRNKGVKSTVKMRQVKMISKSIGR